MGLVVETYTLHVPTTRVCTDGSSSSGIDDTGSFDKSIYRVFSMQDDMKTLVAPVRTKNEFDLFVQYAQTKTAGGVYDSGFDSLDTYLGTIGVTQEMCEG